MPRSCATGLGVYPSPLAPPTMDSCRAFSLLAASGSSRSCLMSVSALVTEDVDPSRRTCSGSFNFCFDGESVRIVSFRW